MKHFRKYETPLMIINCEIKDVLLFSNVGVVDTNFEYDDSDWL